MKFILAIGVFFLTILMSCEQEVMDERKDDELKQLKELSYQFAKENDSLNFTKANRSYLNKALKLNDSASIADAYWNYGLYYDKRDQIDSAYSYFSKTYSYFYRLKNYRYAAKQLYQLANIKNRTQDLTGAESFAFRSLEMADKDDIKLRVLNRNLLALVYQSSTNKEEAIKQYKLGLELIKRHPKHSKLQRTLYNNLGVLYLNTGEYEKSIANLKKAYEYIDTEDLERITRNKNNRFQARLMMGDTSKEIERGLLETLETREQLNLKSGIADSYIHLAEYYAKTKDSLKAINLAKKAITQAGEAQYYKAELEAYALLGELDPKNTVTYFKASNKLRDRIEKLNRANRNQFARVEFETNQYKEQSIKLIKVNSFLIAFIVMIILIITLINYSIIQKNKRNRIALLNEIEADKSELLQLMSQLQINLNEGKKRERNRISMELHDGILGSIAGLRISISHLRWLSNKNKKTPIPFEEYEAELKRLEYEIRSISQGLNENLDVNLNLNAIIQSYLDSYSENIQMNILTEELTDIDWESFSSKASQNLLRIVQEAFRNSLKHSNSSQFKITYEQTQDGFMLNISDNGSGFNPKKEHRGIGLKNIRKRVETLNGTLHIISNNTGTELLIKIPKEDLTKEA